MPLPTEVEKREGAIIDLESRVLSPTTWREFKRHGANPRVAEWVRRVDEGESVERIAWESRYAVSTLRGMISNYRLYLRVCKLNGVGPEGAADV